HPVPTRRSSDLAQLAESVQLLATNAFEGQHFLAEYVALEYRVQLPCPFRVLTRRHQLHVTFRQSIHTGMQDDMAVVDEHDVRQEVLDLLDLVGGDEDRTLLVEVVIQEVSVKLLAKDDVEAERGLVQNKEPGIDRGNDRQVQLRHHAFR